MKNRQVGRQGESLAADYLTRLGYLLLERNFHTRFGEIDLICRDGQDLVFVEVKARTSHRFGLPEEAITWSKRRKLRLAIAAYLQVSKLRFRRLRLEVVAIDLQPETLTPLDIRHIKDIFQ